MILSKVAIQWWKSFVENLPKPWLTVSAVKQCEFLVDRVRHERVMRILDQRPSSSNIFSSLIICCLNWTTRSSILHRSSPLPHRTRLSCLFKWHLISHLLVRRPARLRHLARLGRNRSNVFTWLQVAIRRARHIVLRRSIINVDLNQYRILFSPMMHRSVSLHGSIGWNCVAVKMILPIPQNIVDSSSPTVPVVRHSSWKKIIRLTWNRVFALWHETSNRVVSIRAQTISPLSTTRQQQRSLAVTTKTRTINHSQHGHRNRRSSLQLTRMANRN